MDTGFKNGTYFLSGRLDEYADFEALVDVPTPLRLNLGKISSINSVGVRKFLAFILARAPKKCEFFECTPEFIANVNVIPQMLGQPSDPTQIKSFYVPYSCENCKRVEQVLFEREKIQYDGEGDVITNPRNCSKCNEPLDLDVEKTEYFTFLQDTSG